MGGRMIVCHISKDLTQEEIDNQPVWQVFPNCDKCNPTNHIIILGQENPEIYCNPIQICDEAEQTLDKYLEA